MSQDPVVLRDLTDASPISRDRTTVAHPGRWLRRLTDDGPVFALVILIGLNCVDELDRTAFGVLLPEIRHSFGLGIQGILTLVAVVSAGALVLQLPIAHLADRSNRVRIALIGAAAWALFSVGTGLATGVIFLAVTRAGSGIGKAVVDPTHNSLLADYFAPETRPRVFSLHRAANAVGAFIGPLAAGLLAYSFGWRTPFFIFAVPTVILVLIGLKLREPVRGAQERRAMGATEEAIATEEHPPSFAESWRTVWKIESLRRIWYALPFLAASLVGFVSLAALLYEQAFALDERARGFVAASVEPAQLVGLVIGARVGTKLVAKDPGLVLRFLSVVAFVVSGTAVVFALVPNLGVAIVSNMVIAASLAILGPGILAALSLAIPPRSRAVGFSVASLWVLPGLLVLPIIGALADHLGIRTGMLLMTPVFLIGGLAVASAGTVLHRDITQVWTAAAARSEVAYERQQGRSKLLLVRGLDVSYGNVQVLFKVDFEVDEGEIIALLGTNGAGKSTLLKAIAGAVLADRGAVIFDGRESTDAPPHEVAERGIVLVPGGKGVFPSLTVRDNLGVAGWMQRHRKAEATTGVARVLELFPVLASRLDDDAGDLSGGQQQMLALGMALVSKPRLLMIDELSLGLAPVVVAQLLPVLGELRDQGTTIILVEQSVNLALTVAETAYFMEKGEIRFHGPTAELLDRPDVLRSVFLEGAATANGARSKQANGRTPVPTVPAQAPSPADSPRPVLEGRELRRRFGGAVAVDAVDLAVATGEIVGIIGPNGAGKTTLFDLISGFIEPDSGRVLLGGHDVTRSSPAARARRGLGRSFQDARLFPAMTVTEAVAVALERWVQVRDPVQAALHLPTVFDAEKRVRQRVDELLDLLGLDAYRAKFVGELSTGSRRVVDLACLVAHRPSVILLDEPSSGIAQREAEALGPLIRRISDETGSSILLIEHDMPLITSVADRLVAMEQGRVIVEGPAEHVLHHVDVVASYLGTTESVIARSGHR